MVAVKLLSEKDGKEQGGFVDAKNWTGRYQRNNKRSGLKNLRCFPYCSDSHRLRGFCGRQVVLTYTNKAKDTLYSWAEFCKVDSEGNGHAHGKGKGKSKDKSLSVGDILTRQQIDLKTRTKEDAFRPWYCGEPIDGEHSRTDAKMVFEYNKARKGWNYGWVANKHTCDSHHVLRAYVFKLLPNKSFQCVAVFDSPQFTLFCRRRQRHNLANLPEHLKEQLKTEDAIRKRNLNASGASQQPLKKLKRETREAPHITKTEDVEIEPGPIVGFQDLKQEFSPIPGDMETASSTSSAKSELTQEQRDDLLWRIIQGLLKLEVDERMNSNTAEKDIKPAPGTDVHVPENQENVNAGALSKDDNALDDFLESLIPEFDESEELDLDPFAFNSDIEPLFVDLTDIKMNEMFCKDSVLEELARFMIDEKKFTSAIEQVLVGQTGKNLTVEEQRRNLLDVFAEQIDVFLKRFAMSLEDLDRLLSPSKMKSSLVKKVSKQIPIYTSAKPKKAFSRNSGSLPKLSGKWVRTQETLDIMESIRHQCGLPWLIRRVLHKMEKDFELHLTKHTLEYRLKKKLMFSGVIQYKLDGKEHPYNIPNLLPQPDEPEEDGKKSFSPTYCAYAEDRRLIIIKNLTASKRMWRSVSVTPDGDKLVSTISFQEQSESSEWVSKGMWRGIADRVE